MGKKVSIGIIIGILLAIFSNLILYHSIKYFDFITNGDNFLCENLFNLQVPGFVIPGLITIITIFFMIVTLSFSLAPKLPDKIIEDYILYSKILWIYLSFQSSIVVILLIIIFLNNLDLYWRYIFIFDLGISVIITFYFFIWFLKRTNKEEIYKILENNIYKRKIKENADFLNEIKFKKVSIENLGSRTKLFFENFDKKKVEEKNASDKRDTLPELVTTKDKEGLNHYVHFSSRHGIVKINKVKFEKTIKEYQNSNNIKEISIVNNGTFVTRFHPIFEIIFYTEEKKEIQGLIKELSSSIEQLKVQEDVKELNDWLLCLTHSRENNPIQLEEDFKFLEKILIRSAEYNIDLFKSIIQNLEKNFDDSLENNEKIFEQTIILYYKLRPYYINKPYLLNFIQNTFRNLLINYSLTLQGRYSSKYVSSILYLSELLNYEFKNQFEEESDIQKLQNYDIIIKNVIESAYNILINTVKSFYQDKKNFKFYLKKHMQQFINLIQFFKDNPYQYNNKYYQLGGEEKNIIDKKCSIIKNANNLKKLKIAELSFYLVYLIDKQKLSTSNMDLVFEFMNYGNIYGDIDPSPLWIFEEKLHESSVFVADDSPKWRYLILFNFYLKHNKKEFKLPICKFENISVVEKLRDEIESVNYDFINSMFKLKENEFGNIKQELIDEIGKCLELCKKDEEKLIVNSELDQELISAFVNSVEQNWKSNTVIRKLFEDNNNYELKLDENPPDNPDRYFGFYFLFEKSYFIKNSPANWVRTLDSDYGNMLAKSENEKLLEKIISTKDLSVVEGDFKEILNQCIDSFDEKQNLVVFSDNKLIRRFEKLNNFNPVYVKDELDFPKNHHSYVGYLEFDDTNIPIYLFYNINSVVVIKMDTIGKLVQYRPFVDVEEKELYVNISELNDEEIQEIDKPNVGKAKIKIRIAEKFRIENIDTNSFEGFQIENEN